ncbi:hypothetical protein GJ744_004492 [Endocarpon pusillum]|uniref:Rhodopsin domain-containing protein n=1 Tax=Endocarpon pusillum TaxID=364733 RepID=A0A8H7E9G9_9EURO|nr:hypothetical protein GJ744_004492 [Endocarpon pusillum]
MDHNSGIVGGLPPPPGVTPDFQDPVSLHTYNIVCQAVCLSASTLFVWARMYSKARFMPPLGVEDYTCLIAWVSLVIYGVLLLHLARYGHGLHMWDVPLETATEWRKWENLQEIIYGPIILITKISILLLYSKLFAPSRKSATYINIQLLLYLCILFYTAITLAKIFQCTPRTKIWNPTLPGRCIKLGALFIASSVFNTSSDFAILVIPIFVVWRLQIPIERKVWISVAFTGASFAPVAGILRMVATIQGAASRDATYTMFSVSLWTEAEITTGIICSCLPALPALYRQYGPQMRAKLFCSTTSRQKSTTTSISNFTFPRTKVASRNYDAGDPELAYGDYLELDTAPDRKTIGGYARGPITKIEGGVYTDQRSAKESVRSSTVVGDPSAERGIRKTVSVDHHASSSA